MVLKGYDVWALEVLSRLPGMFALALFDPREATLLVARDRAGIKPLYYARRPHVTRPRHDFRCALVGDGPLRTEAEARARRLDLAQSLTFTGSVEPERVAQFYRRADVVVLASFSEGVPVVLLEAMARGLPVVATSVGGVPELVKDGYNGLVVPPGDADAFCAWLSICPRQS